MRIAVPLSLLAGCTGSNVTLSTPTGSEEVVDMRRTFPDPPAGGVQFATPDYEIPPHSEVQWCAFFNYDGRDVGIAAQWTYQSHGGHHVTLNTTSAPEDVYADGAVFDCTEVDALPMTDLEPVLVGGDVGGPGDPDGPEGSYILPPGMAAELAGGKRIILQSHYINTTADTILVGDAINIAFLDSDLVETWAAPFVLVDTDVVVPKGEFAHSFDCEIDRPLQMMFLGGHMHEWGTAFSAVQHRGSSSTVLYDIPVWDPVMRDAPPYEDYGTNGLEILPGDTFTTNCAWNNDTDHSLTFPEEMCVTFAMVYPQKVPIICDP